MNKDVRLIAFVVKYILENELEALDLVESDYDDLSKKIEENFKDNESRKIKRRRLREKEDRKKESNKKESVKKSRKKEK